MKKRPHMSDRGTHSDKNIITCLMYNKGKHDGSDLNIFFNQFVHHPDFKSLPTGPQLKKRNSSS